MNAELIVNVPEELASQLRPFEEKLPQILHLGLRQWHAGGNGNYAGLADVMETLANLPTPDEVLALRPSPKMKERIDQLLEKNAAGVLETEEEREWQQYEFVEHLVRIAKAKAALKLKRSEGTNEPDVHSN